MTQRREHLLPCDDMRRSSLYFSVPALLIAAALCGLAWFPVAPFVLIALGAVSFVLLAIGFARALSKQESSYVTLAVPPVAFVALLMAFAFFGWNQERIESMRTLPHDTPGADESR
jgi:Flp pilus assembly protein TadB